MAASSGSLGGSAIIKVDTQQLKTTSSSLNGKITAANSKLDTIRSLVEKSTSYWEGEAGDAYRKAFAATKADVDLLIRRLSEHVTDLEIMAGVYEKTEMAVSETAGNLPDEVLF